MNPVEEYESNNSMWWILAGVGAAIGIAYAASSYRSRRSGWAIAKRVTRTVAASRDELADVGKDMLQRIGIIYDQSRKVVEEAGELWSQGRKVLRRAA